MTSLPPHCEGAHPYVLPFLCTEPKYAALKLPGLLSGATHRALSFLHVWYTLIQLSVLSLRTHLFNLSQLLAHFSWVLLPNLSPSLLPSPGNSKIVLPNLCFGILGEILIVISLQKRTNEKRELSMRRLDFMARWVWKRSFYWSMPLLTSCTRNEQVPELYLRLCIIKLDFFIRHFSSC